PLSLRLRPPLSALVPYTTLFRSRWKAAAVHADGSSDPHLRLHEAVVSALAGAVKEENDRPLLLFCPRVRNEDLIFVLGARDGYGDRKSTRLNSSHRTISYAVFCL